MLACHCCHSARPDEDNADVVSDMPSAAPCVDHLKVLTGEAELPHVFPCGPKVNGAQSYGLSQMGPLSGEPRRRGHVLLLQQEQASSKVNSGMNQQVSEATLTVYAKGFTIMSASTPETVPEADENSYSWSPFSTVERYENPLLAKITAKMKLCLFKLTTFRRQGDMDYAFYFATVGEGADEERSAWIEAIVYAIKAVTESLFPLDHTITANPVPGVHSTSTRIMAGYLLHLAEDDVVCVMYCELHTYLCGESRLSAYQNDWCDWEIMNVPLTDKSIIVQRKGFRCSAFCIDANTFAARSDIERELWLRALGNVKVKLMFDAPDPTSEDLAVMRRSVHESVLCMVETLSGDEEHRVCSKGPLLPGIPRGPLPASPIGDTDAASHADHSSELHCEL